MNSFSSRPRCLRLTALALCLSMQTAARAQEPPPPEEEEPFIEPVEVHEMAGALEAVEPLPGQKGRWNTLPFTVPINPVHVALMHTGKALIVAGSGNDPDSRHFQAAVWEVKAGTIRTFNLGWDMFCNGMVILPDGRPFVLGGTTHYDRFLGEPKTAAFDPVTEKFKDLSRMSGGRWYPTGTVLGDGSVLVYSGFNDSNGKINRTVQIWKGKAWTAAGTVFSGVPLYPREHLLPDGKVFESGSNRDSKIYDPATHTFTPRATTLYDRNRDYGTSVLLPLTPENGWKPKVMILGGSYPKGTDTTELIDLSVPFSQWIFGPKMARGRIQLNATLLPDGKVLVSGGSVRDEDTGTAVKEAEIYDPESNTFKPASTMQFPRLYHSNTLLLPDAKVAALGGNPHRRAYQHEIEIYSPSYLFNSDGTAAKRPALTQVPSRPIRYGRQFQVRSPDAADIKSIVLIRPAAVTHSFDMEQRLVGLRFTIEKGVLKPRAPANGNLAPPGYYLLFLLNSKGVPSEGQFVRLRP